MKLRYKISLGIALFLAVSVGSLAFVISHTSECGPEPMALVQGQSMKAIQYRCYGSPEVLKLVEIEKPEPAPNEVLIAVKNAAVNPLDWHYMRGSPYFMRLMAGIGKPDDPNMGVDFAGTVEAIGSEVTRFDVGDRVFGGWSGAFGEYVSMPETRGLAKIPDDISFEQAAATPIAAITALQALRDKGQLQEGQKVLINGASGGVGTYAVQIAKAWGAEVHGVCSTRNVEMVQSIGADRVFDYKKENYTESEERYDLIIDNVGNHSPLANSRVMADDGILVIVGGAKGDWIGPMMGSIQATVTDPFVSQSFEGILARLMPDDLELIADLMAAGSMRSVIDQRYALEDIGEAVAYSESGRVRGKIIVNVM